MGKAAWIRACAAGIAGVAAIWIVSALRRALLAALQRPAAEAAPPGADPSATPA
jgi:hypothetical protein